MLGAITRSIVVRANAGLRSAGTLKIHLARQISTGFLASRQLAVSAPHRRPQGLQLRHLRTTTPVRAARTGRYATGELTPTPLGQSVYDHISERDMEILYECLEELCENHGASGWEVEYSAGVLNLSLPPHGTYVLNKQPPNQQIWMSSPISGPCRFGFVASGEEQSDSLGEESEGTWSHFRKEGVNLGTVLEGEIRALCEQSAVGEGWAGINLP